MKLITESSYYSFLIKNLNITNIPFDIQKIIYLFDGSIFGKMRNLNNLIGNQQEKRKKGEDKGIPDCCITNYILNKKSVSYPLNQVLAIGIHTPYKPCEECAIKILKGNE